MQPLLSTLLGDLGSSHCYGPGQSDDRRGDTLSEGLGAPEPQFGDLTLGGLLGGLSLDNLDLDQFVERP